MSFLLRRGSIRQSLDRCEANSHKTCEFLQDLTNCTSSHDFPFRLGTYPATKPGTTGSGGCFFGYPSVAAHATRSCSSTGVWSATIHNRCLAIKCASLGTSADGVISPATPTGPGHRAVGKCPTGTTGAPYADCNLGGTWSAITGTCSSK